MLREAEGEPDFRLIPCNEVIFMYVRCSLQLVSLWTVRPDRPPQDLSAAAAGFQPCIIVGISQLLGIDGLFHG